MRNFPRSILGFVFLLSLAGCAATMPAIPVDVAAPRTPEGLVRVQNSRFDEVWVRPGFDLLSYDSVILRTPSISYTSTGSGNELTDRQTDVMIGYFRNTLEETFADTYRLVEEPSGRTLVVQAGIADLEIIVPARRTGIGRSQVFAASSGEMSLNVELVNAESGEMLARVIDRRAPQNYWHEVTTVSEWAAVRRAFAFWSGIARQRMDELVSLRSANQSIDAKRAQTNE